MDGDALVRQAVAHHTGQLGIILGQHRQRFQNRHLGAEPAMGLRHFQTDRTAADDDQMPRQVSVREQGLVGEVGHLGQAGDRRHGGGRAGRNDEPFRPDPVGAGFDLARPDEPGRDPQHGAAEPFEALLAVGRSGRRDHAVHMAVDLLEVDLGRACGHTEPAGIADGLGGAAGGEQRLGRHAAIVQTIAAHLALLDQHGPRAHLRRAGGHRQPGRAGADDADIGVNLRHHVLCRVRLSLPRAADP